MWKLCFGVILISVIISAKSEKLKLNKLGIDNGGYTDLTFRISNKLDEDDCVDILHNLRVSCQKALELEIRMLRLQIT